MLSERLLLDVTVSDVTYRMLAADGGVKWRGLSVNGQYFFRWLNNFRADGPIPVSETFDHGFEFVVGGFVVPKKWEVYGRTSFVFGQFRNSYEYAPGIKWYPLHNNHRVWVVAEGLRICQFSGMRRSLLHTTQGLTVGRQCFSGCSISESGNIRRWG